MNNKQNISNDKQKELEEKYQEEGAIRKLYGSIALITTFIALAMAIFHLYTAGFGLLETLRHRAIHLLFVLPLVFLLYPITRKSNQRKVPILDLGFAFLSSISVGYLVFQYQDILMRGGIPNQLDIIMGISTIILVLEAVRRAVGKELLIIATIFLLYGYFGSYMPGMFQHAGASIQRLVDHLYMVPEGIFGIALGTSATYIILFIIFGAFMERSGLGILIQNLALSLAGRSVGGPAKVSVIASGMFGSISGSAASNAVTTGAFTIPLMKRVGYSKEMSAGIEASASTGGQLMPPIMGSAAFIMADYLGIPYLTILVAAIIPVILYYTGVIMMVHLRAQKLGLKGLSKEEVPSVKLTLIERGHLIIPVIIIITLLITGFTPLYAGFWGIISTVIVSLLKKETRMSFKDIIWALETGAKRTIPVAIAVASVGLVIGIFTLTGVAQTVSNYILNLSQGSLLLTLILVMLLSIIMGMGLPTVAAYVLLATVAAPIITTFDVPALAAHFFVFYFGLLANVTPPVAIPAYAASGVAGANPSKAAWSALKITTAGFIVPYMFIYSPEVLFIDFTWTNVIFTAVTAFIAVCAVASAIESYFLIPLAWWERVLLFVVGLVTVMSGSVGSIIGISIFIVFYFTQKYKVKQNQFNNTGKHLLKKEI